MSEPKSSWYEDSQDNSQFFESPLPQDQEINVGMDKLSIAKTETASSSTTISAAPTATTDETNGDDSLMSKDITSFEELSLDENILKGIYQMGFNKPSIIQGKTLPIILGRGVNLIAQSQSGTGKTLCFALGMLSFVKPNVKQPQALCICPTYELGLQIYDVLKNLSKFTDFTVGSALKGTKDAPNEQVIIGTPGTVLGLLTRKKMNPKMIQMLVIDEADEMLEAEKRGLGVDTQKIKNKLPKNCRVLLFSATYKEGDTDADGEKKEKAVLEFAKTVVPPPYELILLPPEKLTVNSMKQFFVNCGSEKGKEDLLKEIYENLSVGQSIIFTNTRKKGDALKAMLEKEGFKVSLLHKDVDDRKKVIKDFRDVKAKVLISTNVLARGLDIDTVTHVINYDLAVTVDGKPDYSTYLHRIGRTARFGRRGVAVNFVASKEDVDIINAYEKYYKKHIKEVNKENIEEELK